MHGRFGQSATEGEFRQQHGRRPNGGEGQHEAGKEINADDVVYIDRRHRLEQQHRQRDPVDEPVQCLAAGVAQQSTAAGDVSGGDDPEYGQNDVEDRFHGPAGLGHQCFAAHHNGKDAELNS